MILDNADPRILRFRGQAQTQTGLLINIDVPWMSHIEDNLWMGGCRDGLILPPDIQHVVSLYPWEQYTMGEVRSFSLNFLHDTLEAPPPRVHDIAAWADACWADGPTLVHCQSGLNRSGLVCALVLMRRGRTAQEAIAFLRSRRSPAVLFNSAFREWVEASDPGARSVLLLPGVS